MSNESKEILSRWLPTIVAGFVGEAAVAAILADFVFATSTAVMWWFGSRPLHRTAK